LRGPVYFGGPRTHGNRALVHSEHGRAGGRRAEASRDEPDSRVGDDRGAGWDVVVAARFSVRAGAHLVRDVARWATAEAVFESASKVRDAPRKYVDRGAGGGDSGGDLGYR